MTKHYDEREIDSPEIRKKRLSSGLVDLLQAAVQMSPVWAQRLADFDIADIRDVDDLAALPVLRKSDLKTEQKARPPFGGFTSSDPKGWGRIFMSPGPIFEPMGTGSDPYRAARALFAAGFRPGDLVHNSFSYHLTPGGFILDSAARALGCAVFPAGIGNTEMQIEAMAHFKPTAFTGTPDYLKILLDKAAETGADLSSVTKALVSGGALFPSLRAEYAERGVEVLQCYATADVGTIAYESEAKEGMIISEDIIVEIVRPGTGDPVPDGEVGEVVVTAPSPVYPMIRFATGDLSAILPGQSPCGRTNRRIKGWMGRADQTAKIKGMFVHPEQVAKVAASHEDVVKIRFVVTRDGEQDALAVKAETAAPTDGLRNALAETVKTICKVRGNIELTAPGELANDGVVIDDQRNYET